MRCSVLNKATTSDRCSRSGLIFGLHTRLIRHRKESPSPVQNSLQGLLVQLEQDLERRTDARHLEFAPKAALVAAHAVHDTGHVSKVTLELLL